MDHLGFASLETLRNLGFAPGAMTLGDVATTERIAETVGADRQVSGGAEANTAVGLASFGARPAFVGAVGSDELGDRYRADLEAAGVRIRSPRANRPRWRQRDLQRVAALCLVTPDAERTMATTLGASVLTPDAMITQPS